MSVTFGTEANAPALAGRVGITRRLSQGGARSSLALGWFACTPLACKMSKTSECVGKRSAPARRIAKALTPPREKVFDARRTACYFGGVIRIANLLLSSALLLQCAAVGF